MKRSVIALAAHCLTYLAAVGLSVAHATWLSAPTSGAQKHLALSEGEHAVVIDREALFQHAPGQTQQVKISPNLTLELTAIRVMPGSGVARTWAGMHRQDGGEYQVFITENEGAISGVIYTADAQFDVLVAPNQNVGRVRDKKAAGIGRAMVPVHPEMLPPLPTFKPIERNDAKALAELKVLPAPQSVIDLMVAYTPGMTTRYGTEAAVVARINSLVAQTNTAYRNSEVAITLRLAGTPKVGYVDTTSNQTALEDLTPSIPEFSRSAINPPSLAGLPAMRETLQADIVILLRPFNSTNHVNCGLAWTNGAVGFGIDIYSGWGYGSVSDGIDAAGVTGTCGDMVLAHEMGHIMGLKHDRANAPAGVPITSYGHGFGYGYNAPGCASLPSAFCGYPTDGDIMSVAYVNRVACFSGPNVWQSSNKKSCGVNLGVGVILGSPADTPVETCASTTAGRPAATPTCAANSNCADASRSLNYVRAKVAQWKDKDSVTVVEFYNRDLDAYFITGRTNEQTAIDGVASFQRTGGTFAAAGSAASTETAGSTPICRYYISVASPYTSSHFYGPRDTDCAVIAAAKPAGFSYDGLDFAVTLPVSGACPASAPFAIYRSFRAGANGKNLEPPMQHVNCALQRDDGEGLEPRRHRLLRGEWDGGGAVRAR